MTYEIGQKVETEKGNGIIVAISGYEEQLYIVEITNIGKWGFNEHQLKPYKTAHEKLIEMGYEYEEHKQGHRYIHRENKDYIDIDLFRESYYHFEFKYQRDYRKTPYPIRHYRTTPYPISTNLELSRILTQYLEEMVE